MSAVLLVVGLIWAVLGVLNIVGQDWENPLAAQMFTFTIIFNMVLFVLPGLLLAGIGSYMARRKIKAATASPGSAEARIANLRELLNEGAITQAEFDAKRSEILSSL